MSNGNGIVATADISSLLTRDIPRPVRLDEQFAIAPNDPVAPTFRRLMPTLELRFQSLENQRPDFELAIRELRDASVIRIDDVLGPAIEKVQAYTELGWFLVRSSTSVDLTVNADRLFIINEGVQRDMFAPTPFLAIQRQSNPDDYAVARLSAYHALGGFLHVRILARWGNPGPFNDWTITSAPGISEATHYWYERTVTLGNRSEADADRATTEADRAGANADRSQVNRDWMDQVRDQLTESGIDTSAFSWRDGSRPFTGVVAGVAPAGAANDASLVTASWTRARLAELGGGGNLLPATNPTFTGVITGPEMRLGSAGPTGGATTRNAAGRLSLSAGGFWNGTAFQASAAQASLIDQFNAETTFNSNSGLSVGSTYTPTPVARISAAGLNVLQGTLQVAGTNIATIYAPIANPNFTGTLRLNGAPLSQTANVPQNVTPSGTAVDGDLWFDTAGLSLFIRFNGQWVPAMGVMTLAYAPLANPPNGQNNYAPIAAPTFTGLATGLELLLTRYNTPALGVGGTTINNAMGIMQAGAPPGGFLQIAHGARGAGGQWIATDTNAQVIMMSGDTIDFYCAPGENQPPLTIGQPITLGTARRGFQIWDTGAWANQWFGCDDWMGCRTFECWEHATFDYVHVREIRSPGEGHINQLYTNFQLCHYDITVNGHIYTGGVVYAGQLCSNAWYMRASHLGNFWGFDEADWSLKWYSYGRGLWYQLRGDAAAINWQGTTFSVGWGDLCDNRSKKDIELDHHGLDVIKRLNPIEFERTMDPVPHALHRDIGFSAQEVAEVLPEAALVCGVEMPDGSGGLNTADPSLAVSLTALIAVCVNGIKELAARVETLEQRRN